MPSYFATTFAFCFDMHEGILLFSGFQAMTAIFWLASVSFAVESWPRSDWLRGISILLLILNSLLGSVAARTSSERCALGLTVAYGMLILCLTIDFGLNHPSECSEAATAEDSALGRLVTRLLWTTDACLLMTILGWVTVGVGYAMAMYLWYMCVCFWQLLREAGADTRRVARALATLPTLRYKSKTAASQPLLTGEIDVGESCAICLSEYEEGEELRSLPCKHVFRRECIDSWISRQGVSASCPLCKQLIVSSLLNAQPPPDAQPGSSSAVAEEGAPNGSDEPVSGSVAPLDARLVVQPADASSSAEGEAAPAPAPAPALASSAAAAAAEPPADEEVEEGVTSEV